MLSHDTLAVMIKKKSPHRKKPEHYHHNRSIRWLPISSRWLPLKLTKVTGVARLFLEIEITLAIFIVVGAIVVGILNVVSTLLNK